MKLKDIRNLVSAKNAKKVALGWVALFVTGCAENKNLALSETDKEIAAAQISLDSLNQLCIQTEATCDMYARKRKALMPVVGVQEDSVIRARKDAEWCQYRDSVFKYSDRLVDLLVEREWAKLRVESLKDKRHIIKSR